MSRLLIGICAAILVQQSVMATEVVDVKPGKEAYLNVIGMSLVVDVAPANEVTALPAKSNGDSVIGMAVVDDIKPADGLNHNAKN